MCLGKSSKQLSARIKERKKRSAVGLEEISFVALVSSLPFHFVMIWAIILANGSTTT